MRVVPTQNWVVCRNIIEGIVKWKIHFLFVFLASPSGSFPHKESNISFDQST